MADPAHLSLRPPVDTTVVVDRLRTCAGWRGLCDVVLRRSTGDERVGLPADPYPRRGRRTSVAIRVTVSSEGGSPV